VSSSEWLPHEAHEPHEPLELPPIADANSLLLDRQLYDDEGRAIGKVDDLELSDPHDGPPVLTALLCGPTALGPRIGDTVGTLWFELGRLLRPGHDPYPDRIPISDVIVLNRTEIRVRNVPDSFGARRVERWLRTNIIERIPGS
jgi:hypothetical protein